MAGTWCNERTLILGLKFGTVTAVFEGVPFELTTFRADCGIKDGRHPQSVSFVRDIVSDLSRRDFTVNAMAWSPEKGLVDPFGGREDITKRLIRCVGEPSLRFEEDALRILRSLRFMSRLGFRLDDETAKALRQNAFRLKTISRERIFSELSGIIQARAPGPPSTMALATPTMVPVPTVAARLVISA